MPSAARRHTAHAADRLQTLLQQVTQLGFRQSVATLWMTLWDEDERRLIGFRDLKPVRRRLEESEGGSAAIGATRPGVVPVTWR